MLLRLILLLTLVPILELILVVEVHNHIAETWDSQSAWLLTIGTILCTGILGAHLAKAQGTATIHQARQQIAYGQMPAASLLHGLLIAIGAALLLTPGYITDGLGFFLLLPWTRQLTLKGFETKLSSMVKQGRVHVHTQSYYQSSHRPSEPHIIDVSSRDNS